MTLHADPDDPTMYVRGLLAIELSPDADFTRDVLSQADAGRLAALLGRDLAALVPEAHGLDLVFAAAHFDPAEVLRAGWPLHQRLEELHRRAPRSGQGPRIIAFGADHDGQVPAPLQADAGLRGGRLRVAPFLLSGPTRAVRPVADHLEQVLLDTGMAQADTALLAQEAFGARIEHTRYFTAHDLAAMMAMQYANLGLAPLWRVIETALFSPDAATEIDAPPEPLLRYDAGEARIALFSPDAWRRRHAAHAADADVDPARLERRFEAFEARQRQYAAVLQAHGIDVTFAHCDDPADL